MILAQEFHDSSGKTVAIHFRGRLDAEGVYFPLPPENSFQIGFMKRSPSSPASPHFHAPQTRTVFDTQELLIVMQGSMTVNLFDSDGQTIDSLNVEAPDLILLCGGGHGVTFSEDCNVIEIKQGPYMSDNDKISVNPLHHNS